MRAARPGRRRAPRRRTHDSRQNARSQRRDAAGMWVGVPARAHSRAPVAGEPCSPVRESRACDACHAATCAWARWSMCHRAALGSVCAQGHCRALPRAALHGKASCGYLRCGVIVSPGTAQLGVLPGSQAICRGRSGLACLVGPPVFVRFSVRWQGDMEVTDCCAGQDAETAGLQVGTTARQDHAHPERSQCRPCQVRHQGTDGLPLASACAVAKSGGEKGRKGA